MLCKCYKSKSEFLLSKYRYRHNDLTSEVLLGKSGTIFYQWILRYCVCDIENNFIILPRPRDSYRTQKRQKVSDKS